MVVPVNSLRAHIVELPYEGEEVSMYLILPDQTLGADANTVLNSLTKSNLERAIKLMRKVPISVSMPRFKITSQFNDEIKDVSWFY